MSDILAAFDDVFYRESIDPESQFTVTCSGGLMVITRVGRAPIRMRYDTETNRFVKFEVKELKDEQLRGLVKSLKRGGAVVQDISKLVGQSVSRVRHLLAN